MSFPDIVFCIDELLTRLKHSGYGCMVGNEYCGAFAYADDIALVAPTTHALKAMCDICTNFAHEYDIQFKKAKCQLKSNMTNSMMYLYISMER